MFATHSDSNFLRSFLISLGAHILLLVIGYFGGKILMSAFRNNDVEIIRSAVRVDVVGMPKFTVQELKEMQKNIIPASEPEVAQGAKVETKVKDEAPDVIKKDDLVIQEVSKKKAKKSSFLNMISDYSSKKVEAKVEKPQGKEAAKGIKNLESLVVEGNRLSKGSALVGDFSEEGSSEFASYIQTLPESIRQYWKLPSFLLDKNLRCRIKIYLSATGELLKTELLESSGHQEFDARAQKAVRDAAPFPKPTDKVGVRLTNSGIILGFPL
jgi:colicin import membrane protein